MALFKLALVAREIVLRCCLSAATAAVLSKILSPKSNSEEFKPRVMAYKACYFDAARSTKIPDTEIDWTLWIHLEIAEANRFRL